MSGTKRMSLEEDQQAREARMRREAELREQKAKEAALQLLDTRVSELSRVLVLAGCAVESLLTTSQREVLRAASAPSAGAGSSSLLALAAGVESLQPVVRARLGLLGRLEALELRLAGVQGEPAGAFARLVRVGERWLAGLQVAPCEGLEETLAFSRRVQQLDAGLEAAAAQLGRFGPLGQRSRDAFLARLEMVQDEAALVRIVGEQGMVRDTTAQSAHLLRLGTSRALLERCVQAGVTLTEGEQRIHRDIIEKLVTGSPATIQRLARDAGRTVRSRSLGRELEQRRDALRRLAAPSSPWRAHLTEWRSDLPSELATAQEQVECGDWRGVAPLLDEVDDLLEARARGRIELVRQAADASGFSVDDACYDPALRVLVARIHDPHGLLLQASERVARWFDLDHEERMILQGPSNWNGPQCVSEGVGRIRACLSEQGATTHLWDGQGRLLDETPPAVPRSTAQRSTHHRRDEELA